jgi:hypothetical protein
MCHAIFNSRRCAQVATAGGCRLCRRARDEMCHHQSVGVLRHSPGGCAHEARLRLPLFERVRRPQSALAIYKQGSSLLRIRFRCKRRLRASWLVNARPVHLFVTCHPTWWRPAWPPARRWSCVLTVLTRRFWHSTLWTQRRVDQGVEGLRWAELTSASATPPRARTPPFKCSRKNL